MNQEKQNNQPDIDKTYLYPKDPYEAKHQDLFDKPKEVGLKRYDDLKAFIEYSKIMQNFHKNIKEHNLGKNAKY